MPRKINDRQKRMLIAILMHDTDTINMVKAGQTLKTLMKVGYIEETLKKGEGFRGWKITEAGHVYLSKVRK